MHALCLKPVLTGIVHVHERNQQTDTEHKNLHTSNISGNRHCSSSKNEDKNLKKHVACNQRHFGMRKTRSAVGGKLRSMFLLQWKPAGKATLSQDGHVSQT
ncbi:Homoserine O-succinyltransferase [Trichinella pseudospiralis]